LAQGFLARFGRGHAFSGKLCQFRAGFRELLSGNDLVPVDALECDGVDVFCRSLREWAMMRFCEATVWSLALVLLATLAGCGHAPPGVQLIYELDPPPQGAQGSMLVDRTAQVMEDRLGEAGEVLVLPNGQIAVILYGSPTATALAALKQRVGLVGVLEFRIMASEKFPEHQPIIEEARKLAESESTVVDAGTTVARWQPLDGEEFPTLEEATMRGLVTRMVGTTPQALVLLNDGQHVGGQHLTHVSPELDEKGKPQLGVSFGAKGAFLFGQLTEQHLPTAAGDRYHLGIVLDGMVMSAPTIESKITNHARVSGSMTQEEVEALVEILRVGQLPSAVKLVGENELK
jgi:preprotein translocase subunit SecD